ncbi:hypothetical protein NDU88_003168 [Pleurodeles waltl]|uniref:Uncharacterized protein n=1 Tax=Pleurodeles waltl TaxID=8319 RepID=A0AAV7T4I1_PLEWA|nr:hypothetical protein NDU88_003168 [Pleurodeles waltl]
MLPAAALHGAGLRFPRGTWRASGAALTEVRFGAILVVESCRSPPPTPLQSTTFPRRVWGSRLCLGGLDRAAWRPGGRADGFGR